MQKGKWILKCVLGGILFILLFGLITMLLWNWLVPTLFNGPEIEFVQSLGLLVLAKILFQIFGTDFHSRFVFFRYYSQDQIVNGISMRM